MLFGRSSALPAKTHKGINFGSRRASERARFARPTSTARIWGGQVSSSELPRSFRRETLHCTRRPLIRSVSALAGSRGGIKYSTHPAHSPSEPLFFFLFHLPPLYYTTLPLLILGDWIYVYDRPTCPPSLPSFLPLLSQRRIYGRPRRRRHIAHKIHALRPEEPAGRRAGASGIGGMHRSVRPP